MPARRNCLNHQERAVGCAESCGQSLSAGDRIEPRFAMIEQQFTVSMPSLYRSARRILRNTEDSEDALQDALLRALSRLHQFRGESHISTWLYSIVHNSALSHLRKRDRVLLIPIADDVPEEDSSLIDFTLVDSGPNPEEQCSEGELHQILVRTLNGLPRNYRAVVQLCMIESLSYKEAAQQLGLTVNTIKTRLFRARPLFMKGLRSGLATRQRRATRSRPRKSVI
jgi:RNA polymerase sigma factor (sigma-70 family)